MAVYRSTAWTDGGFPKCGRIGWQWYQKVTAVANNWATGFNPPNALPPRTDSAWRPTALPANWELTFETGDSDVSYLGIAKHDLGTLNASLRVQYDVDTEVGGFITIAGLDGIEPEDDSAILFLFPKTTMRRIRLTIISADAMPTISVIQAGDVTIMPRPFVWTGTPITEGDRITYENTTSMSGNFLGRSVARDGLQFELTMNHATESWRQNIFPITKRNINGDNPTFFIAPRPVDYPNEVAYAWLTEPVRAERTISNKGASTSITLRCQGLRPNV